MKIVKTGPAAPSALTVPVAHDPVTEDPKRRNRRQRDERAARLAAARAVIAQPADRDDPNAVDPLIREEQVRQMFPVSHSTLWRMVRDGKFPRPVRISDSMVGYKSSQVAEFLRSLRTASTATGTDSTT